MFRLFFSPEFGFREAQIDEWSGALRVALQRTLAQLQENPLIGESDDPLRGELALLVPLFRGRLNVRILYRVDSLNRTIDLLDIWDERE